MTDQNQPPRNPTAPAAPALPDVDSPPREDVLDGVPSTDAIVERAQSAQEIVDEQPSVDELLQRRR
jgi:hypothetical protein